MIAVVLSRRYARALLALSVRRGDLSETHESVRGIVEIFRRDARVRRFFETPTISRDEKEAFLNREWKPRVNSTAYGLLILLLRRRRLDHLVSIADEFHKLAEEAQGITRAVVRSAVPIGDGQADALTRVLARRTGRKVLLTREIDPALLAGAVVSIDNQVLDGTLATELWRIRRKLLASRVHGRG